MDYFHTRIKKLLYYCINTWTWKFINIGVFPAIEHKKALKNLSFDAVFDVGFHKGQFSALIDNFFPAKEIYAFEPQPFSVFISKKVFKDKKNFRLFNFALGARTCKRRLFIASASDSSSFFPFANSFKSIYKNIKHVKSMPVKVHHLDGFKLQNSFSKDIFLKIDTQGFELEVLKGAKKFLKRCKYIYVECSYISLYEGQPLFHVIQSFLEKRGFKFSSSYNRVFHQGVLLQADVLFERQT